MKSKLGFVTLLGCTAAIAGTTFAIKPELANRLGLGLTPIQAITTTPEQYRDQTVTLRGKVTNQIGILGTGAYEIQDNSGRVWVVTQAGLPTTETQVFVQGSPQEGLSIAGRSLGVTVVETKHWK